MTDFDRYRRPVLPRWIMPRQVLEHDPARRFSSLLQGRILHANA